MVKNIFGSAFVLGLVAATLAPIHASVASIQPAAFSPKSHVLDLKPGDSRIPAPKSENLKDVVEIHRGGNGYSAETNAVMGAIAFAVVDKVARELFKKHSISFPSQLGACMIMFCTMVVGEEIVPGFGDSIFSFLNPGALLLAKWLPVFFVPGLAMLPLAPSIGSPLEVFKVLAVIVLGFVFSLSSTAFAVLGLRTCMGAITPPDAGSTTSMRTNAKGNEAPTTPPKAFSDSTMEFLTKGTVLSTALSIAATRSDMDWANPLRTASMLFATVASYVWGARLPVSFTKVVHPLVTSTALTLCAMALTGLATGSSFMEVLRTYKVGSMSPLETGAGDVLLYLLGPAVVSFAMSMYSRKSLLKENLFVVIVSMLVSSAGGLFGTGAFVRLINLGGASDTFLRRSVLSRNVTTALAIALTAMIEGNLAIAASVVVLTGIIGATYGRTLLTAMGIEDPVSRGLGLGGAGQGLGVASMMSEKDAFPFAAVSMVLTAVCATTLVSIPAVKDALLSLVGPVAALPVPVTP